jgi:hypothetical protein
MSREGSKIRESKGIQEVRRSNEDKPPLSDRSNDSVKRSSNIEKGKNQQLTNNIYTMATGPKKERISNV